MPCCLECAGPVERENDLCDACASRMVARPIPHSGSARQEGSQASSTPDAPEPPAWLAALGWSRWHLAAALGAAAAGAAIMMLLLGTGAGDRSDMPSMDAASFVAPAPRVTPAPPVGGRVKWTEANSARWVSNHRRSIAFELPAENTALAWLTRVRPTLVVRCVSNTTEAFVFTQVPAAIEPDSDMRTVRMGFDGEDDYTTRWNTAEEHDALFVPDPVGFARRLARAQTLRFGFTPHNGPPATITFDVRGFEPHLASIARMCSWK